MTTTSDARKRLAEAGQEVGEMWIAGDEDGCVSVVCSRPECMKPGPVASGNREGLWLDPHVLPYKPDPILIAHAWAEHRATHT